MKLPAGMEKRVKELRQGGWEFRFIVDEPRLTEVVELYKELGFEVLIESVIITGGELTADQDCGHCLLGVKDKVVAIFTRKTGQGH